MGEHPLNGERPHRRRRSTSRKAIGAHNQRSVPRRGSSPCDQGATRQGGGSVLLPQEELSDEPQDEESDDVESQDELSELESQESLDAQASEELAAPSQAPAEQAAQVEQQSESGLQQLQLDLRERCVESPPSGVRGSLSGSMGVEATSPPSTGFIASLSTSF
jgi:hypothetical protein